jgi:hypothetical protein
VREAVNGVLAADVAQATVEIQPYAGMAAGDRVDLQWQGNQTGNYTDWLPVSSATVGNVLTFLVPAGQIASNGSVSVSYRVTRATGGVENSLSLLITVIAGSYDLPKPSVPSASGNGGELLLLDDIYDVDSITVSVPHYNGMANGHKIRVIWQGYETYNTEIKDVVTPGVIEFDIPRAEVIDNIGNSVVVSYTVLRSDNGTVEYSDELAMEIEAQALELPKPVITDGNGTVLVTYPGMHESYKVRVRWIGVETHDTEEKRVDGNDFLTFDIPRQWVNENAERTVLINYSVLHKQGDKLQFSRVLRVIFNRHVR